MGMVYAEIELINNEDAGFARRNIIGEEEIRRLRVTMLVDSGAWMMCINETIQEQLGLPFVERRSFRMADGRPVTYDVVGPVDVRFANRRAMCTAFVLPGDTEPLLGAIPMEEMDVLIHPLRQELIVNPKHPEYAVLRLGGLRPL
ncbi:MAG TPA: retropepsin-like aspartic protease [Puia sp.]